MAKGIYPRVLSIAGTDPTGGAGIQADLKSISAAGGYGMSVVTALVAQNTQGVRSVHVPPVDFLQEQLDSVIDDVEIDAVKIGMLADAAITAKVADFLRRLPDDVPVVLDPVMVATSGDRLLENDAEQAVRDLCSQVDLITPNLKELAVLTQTDEASDLEEAIATAKEWAKGAGTAVVVKGGHLDADIADNAVVNADGSVHRVAASRVDTKNTHGTGCSCSSALATRLGTGSSTLYRHVASRDELLVLLVDAVLGEAPNQIRTRRREDVVPDEAALLDVAATTGSVTEAGVRMNIEVGIRYIESWLRGNGAAAIHGLMEDAATAEISRSQIWQWAHNGTGVQLTEGGVRTANRGWMEQLIREEHARILAGPLPEGHRFEDAVRVFCESALPPEYPAFLTLGAYRRHFAGQDDAAAKA